MFIIMKKSILILNGPNLNMLGSREPSIYGNFTLADIEENSRIVAGELGYSIDFIQDNSEGALVGFIQHAKETYVGIVLNAAGYTHTSVAIHDAVKLCGIPVVEVHISNIYQREDFRHHSFISPVASGIVCGFGTVGYELAIRGIISRL
jgi:3-dehydroquinate dehydratase II